ncbi:Gametocyte-specific factor 1 [Caligus rogercresseyi]|uniref:Gametocyte-specific factor 1 n=1 Tax=Caligus rogercresseyi TaxID=217165 RepID=A0A7T8KH30_CALRO|nr:Gametocyte-specific factor 1 [Caligus rogercresseyi]
MSRKWNKKNPSSKARHGSTRPRIYHRILPERFALHLTRCRKAAALDMVFCPFDSTHHVRSAQLQEHLTTCSGANALREPQRAPAVIPNWKKAQAVETAPQVEMEDWNEDEDDVGVTYNPVDKLLAAPNIILNPQGLTKTQKRAFRANQRHFANSGETGAERFDSMWVPPIAEQK